MRIMRRQPQRQQSQPVRYVQQQPQQAAYPQGQYPAPQGQVQRRSRRGLPFWLMVSGGALLTGFVLTAALIGVILMIFLGSGRILPGVSMLGVPLRGMTGAEAAQALAAAQITLQDGDRTWQVNLSDLGIALDANASAEKAIRSGRGEGSVVTAFLRAQVVPVINVDQVALIDALNKITEHINLPAQNATIRMVNGALIPVSAEAGRVLDVNATAARLLGAGAAEFADGSLDLVMQTTQPEVLDAAPLLDQARLLLASPLSINAYDAITGEKQAWSLPPEQWGAWLTTQNTATGISFSVDGNALSQYLTQMNAMLGSGRGVKVDEAVQQVQEALAQRNNSSAIRIYHEATIYTVQSGDTLGGIAWSMGIPYWFIQEANPGVSLSYVNPGQTLTIPSKDVMLPLPVAFNKRIVVSIIQQRMWVYEDDQLKWEWAASTGIADSPTMPGVYQVQSHDGTAYAGNWNLYMPSFMSIYEAVPGFFNGIHGFPWRNGYQILWENALGSRVTYGCILISTTNAELLYNWAENGVVVEIKA